MTARLVPGELDRIALDAMAADPSWWPSLLERSTVAGADGCVIWTGPIQRTGYGRVSIPARMTEWRGADNRPPRVGIHRLSLVHELGRPLSPGMTTSHKCHDAAAVAGTCEGGTCRHIVCINTAHLAEETIHQNCLSSPTNFLARMARRTHCPNCGAEMVGDNLIAANLRAKRPGKVCRHCQNAKMRARYAARKGA